MSISNPRRVQHRRVERDWCCLPTGLRGHLRVAGYIRPHRLCRSHGGCRNGTGAGGFALIHAIETFAKRLQASGRTLILCGAMQQPSKLLQNPRFLDHVGRENIMPNVQAALDRAGQAYAGQVPTSIPS